MLVVYPRFVLLGGALLVQKLRFPFALAQVRRASILLQRWRGGSDVGIVIFARLIILRFAC